MFPLNPRDAFAAYLHYSARLTGAALCCRGAAMPPTFDWRDATMIYYGEVREPQSVAMIPGCGIPRGPRQLFTWMISGLVGISLAAS